MPAVSIKKFQTSSRSSAGRKMVKKVKGIFRSEVKSKDTSDLLTKRSILKSNEKFKEFLRSLHACALTKKKKKEKKKRKRKEKKRKELQRKVL